MTSGGTENGACRWQDTILPKKIGKAQAGACGAVQGAGGGWQGGSVLAKAAQAQRSKGAQAAAHGTACFIVIDCYFLYIIAIV